MKMIRNKIETVSAQPPFILRLVLMGALRRSCSIAGAALPEPISPRFGTLLRPTIPTREPAQLTGPAHPWLHDFASITVGGLRSRFAWMRARAISRGAA
ncbi:hypothetical protein EH244_29870 [Variovorax beijingensis]|uniref:Uncharacterized protein n=1 Tax=Variovorax beijingensis TaxID=2496117 RepID=A0A3P3E3J2_9BURK|nr:hypothetical protein [Variovorax beijingensis]RRH80961.1 hypothetical protein EH244_29870 [Variovorax beijingensis]RSZ28510.1 hypothetical protein EJO66_31525 [Variovorax beijingensis]